MQLPLRGSVEARLLAQRAGAEEANIAAAAPVIDPQVAVRVAAPIARLEHAFAGGLWPIEATGGTAQVTLPALSAGSALPTALRRPRTLTQVSVLATHGLRAAATAFHEEVDAASAGAQGICSGDVAALQARLFARCAVAAHYGPALAGAGAGAGASASAAAPPMPIAASAPAPLHLPAVTSLFAAPEAAGRATHAGDGSGPDSAGFACALCGVTAEELGAAVAMRALAPVSLARLRAALAAAPLAARARVPGAVNWAADGGCLGEELDGRGPLFCSRHCADQWAHRVTAILTTAAATAAGAGAGTATAAITDSTEMSVLVRAVPAPASHSFAHVGMGPDLGLAQIAAGAPAASSQSASPTPTGGRRLRSCCGAAADASAATRRAAYVNGDSTLLMRSIGWALAPHAHPDEEVPEPFASGAGAGGDAFDASAPATAAQRRAHNADAGSLCSWLTSKLASAWLVVRLALLAAASHVYIAAVVVGLLGLGMRVGRELLSASGASGALSHDTYTLATGALRASLAFSSLSASTSVSFFRCS